MLHLRTETTILLVNYLNWTFYLKLSRLSVYFRFITHLSQYRRKFHNNIHLNRVARQHILFIHFLNQPNDTHYYPETIFRPNSPTEYTKILNFLDIKISLSSSQLQMIIMSHYSTHVNTIRHSQ